MIYLTSCPTWPLASRLAAGRGDLLHAMASETWDQMEMPRTSVVPPSPPLSPGHQELIPGSLTRQGGPERGAGGLNT